MPIPKDKERAELWKKRQRESHLGKSINKGEDNPFFGKKHSIDTIEKLRKKNTGKKHTEATKRKISISHIGKSHPSPRKGKKLSEILGTVKAMEIINMLRENNRGNKYRLGIKHTKEVKEKISRITRLRTPKGENNPKWKGGVSARYIDIFNCNGYVAWRKDVFKRDNYTCQKCRDNRGHNLEAHHKITVKVAFETSRLELIYDVSNGITLCEKCHKEVHKHATIKN
jgi:hypothetical protein